MFIYVCLLCFLGASIVIGLLVYSLSCKTSEKYTDLGNVSFDINKHLEIVVENDDDDDDNDRSQSLKYKKRRYIHSGRRTSVKQVS